MDERLILTICDRLKLRHSHPYVSPGRGTNISIACPLAPFRHSDGHDSNMSCSVRISPGTTSVCQCHSLNCGYRGPFRHLVEKALRLRKVPIDDYRDLILRMEEAEDEDPDKTVARILEPQDPPRLGPNQLACGEGILSDFRRVLPRCALDWGITVEIAERWGLVCDTERKRLVFPVRAPDGTLLGITGRAYGSARGPKYYNYAGLPKTQTVYGSHLWERGRPVLLVEGPKDALIADAAVGATYNVGAVLGSGLSDRQAFVVRSAQPSFVVAMGDGDAAGRKLRDSIALKLTKDAMVLVAAVPEGRDPGEMTKQEIVDAVENATPYVLLDDAISLFHRARKKKQ